MLPPTVATSRWVGAASIVYFGKPCQGLSLPEALTLAVIPRNPEMRNPLAATGRTGLARASAPGAHRWERSYASPRASDLEAALK